MGFTTARPIREKQNPRGVTDCDVMNTLSALLLATLQEFFLGGESCVIFR